jgi:hypothetical protein
MQATPAGILRSVSWIAPAGSRSTTTVRPSDPVAGHLDLRQVRLAVAGLVHRFDRAQQVDRSVEAGRQPGGSGDGGPRELGAVERHQHGVDGPHAAASGCPRGCRRSWRADRPHVDPRLVIHSSPVRRKPRTGPCLLVTLPTFAAALRGCPTRPRRPAANTSERRRARRLAQRRCVGHGRALRVARNAGSWPQPPRDGDEGVA